MLQNLLKKGPVFLFHIKKKEEKTEEEEKIRRFFKKLSFGDFWHFGDVCILMTFQFR